MGYDGFGFSSDGVFLFDLLRRPQPYSKACLLPTLPRGVRLRDLNRRFLAARDFWLSVGMDWADTASDLVLGTEAGFL